MRSHIQHSKDIIKTYPVSYMKIRAQIDAESYMKRYYIFSNPVSFVVFLGILMMINILIY